MTNYKRITNTQPDVPDSRDWIYQPSLTRLSDFIDPAVQKWTPDLRQWLK
ncbi:MAG: hypothetical protein GY814_05380 [Gammaproteobacteria bacterium]|nr:hypothetical protein [Gammaproteobacteria bacterium]